MSTDGKIEAVRKAWREGATKSALHIASFLSEEYGAVSRNSIVGLIYRHGAKMPEVQTQGVNYAIAPAKTKREKRSPVPPPNRRPEPKRKPAAKSAAKKEVPIVDLTPEPVNIEIGPRQLYELGPKDCRWPIDGTGFTALFCAKDIGRHHMWCEAHQKRGYMAR